MAIPYDSRPPYDAPEARNAFTRAAQVAEWISNDVVGIINWQLLGLNYAELMERWADWLRGMVQQWQ